ncbi:MAG: hypothetical protein ACK55I_31640, partial [bacterium]
RIRASTSVPPPGGKGTMMEMPRVGKASCAMAAGARNGAANRAGKARRGLRLGFLSIKRLCGLPSFWHRRILHPIYEATARKALAKAPGFTL